MSDELNRLELLKRAGVMAWKGLKTAITGVDVVIDPNEEPSGQQAGAGEGEGRAAEGGEPVSPPLPPPEAIGTVIGRRAMAAATHRMGAAVMVADGAAVAIADLLADRPLTLVLYPGPAAALVGETLGLEGSMLPLDGDLDVASTAHDMAWLPLAMGERFFGRLASGGLVAAGGYRRAALVRFGGAAPRYPGTWCAMGDDALAQQLGLSDAGLLFEAPDKLWSAIERGQAEAALLGGDLLERALTLPGATVVVELAPRDGLVPVWGLFSAAAGRAPVIAPVDAGAIVIRPVAAASEAEAGAEAGAGPQVAS